MRTGARGRGWCCGSAAAAVAAAGELRWRPPSSLSPSGSMTEPSWAGLSRPRVARSGGSTVDGNALHAQQMRRPARPVASSQQSRGFVVAGGSQGMHVTSNDGETPHPCWVSAPQARWLCNANRGLPARTRPSNEGERAEAGTRDDSAWLLLARPRGRHTQGPSSLC
jgi:hypothetical protein